MNWLTRILIASCVLLLSTTSAPAAEWRPWLKAAWNWSHVDHSGATGAYRDLEASLPGSAEFQGLDDWIDVANFSLGVTIHSNLLLGFEFGTENSLSSRISAFDNTSGNDVQLDYSVNFHAHSYAVTGDWLPLEILHDRVRTGLGVSMGLIDTGGRAGILTSVNGFEIGTSADHESKRGPLLAGRAILDVALLAGFAIEAQFGYRYARANDVTLANAAELDPSDPLYGKSWDADYSGWLGQIGLRFTPPRLSQAN